mgnify:CR=1 FL=1
MVGTIVFVGKRSFASAHRSTEPSSLSTTLAAMLDNMEANNPAITMFRFDVAGLFNQALGDPASFGLTNVTDAAAPGLEPGASSYDTSQIATNPDEYLFWDDVHPTAAVHAVLAEQMLLLFALPGDFNHDDVVDAADYVVWRKTGGTPQQYGEWRANFGRSAAAGASTISPSVPAVPEPSALALMAAGGALLLAQWRRRGRSRSDVTR